VLRRRSVEVLRMLRSQDRQITLISVGGIAGGLDVRERLDAGATLVQAYTAFVYGGPLWPRRVVTELVSLPTTTREDHA
jgi:dihydroorotate dehydrogenase